MFTYVTVLSLPWPCRYVHICIHPYIHTYIHTHSTHNATHGDSHTTQIQIRTHAHTPQAFPFLGPVGKIVSSIASAAQAAKYNIDEAKKLEKGVMEVCMRMFKSYGGMHAYV